MSAFVEEPSMAGVHVRVAEVFAAEDEARSAYLDELVKRGGTCRGCGAAVNDKGLLEHPGVCGVCFTRKKVEPIRIEHQPLPPPAPAAPPRIKTFTRAVPAEPAKEETMPKGYARGAACRSCKATGPRHKKDCPEDGSVAAPEVPAGGGGRRKAARELDTEGLLARRDALLAEVADIEQQIRARIADEEARLDRMRAAVAGLAREAKDAAA